MGDASLMGEARDFLRQATAGAHRRLDENPFVAGLAAGSLSTADYARMLSAYFAFYQPWEAQMNRDFPDLVKATGEFRYLKTGWLRQDLARLGPISRPVSLEPPPLIANPVRAAGALYVVEGSTIGGMHLSRSGRLPSQACTFFTGYGEETMPHWKRLTGDLDGLVSTQAEREEAAVEAASVFDWFQRSFDQLLPLQDR